MLAYAFKRNYIRGMDNKTLKSDIIWFGIILFSQGAIFGAALINLVWFYSKH